MNFYQYFFVEKIRCLDVKEIYEMCQLAVPQVCDIFRDSASSQGPSQTFVNPAVKLNLDIFIRQDILQNICSTEKKYFQKTPKTLSKM